jgi:hypothetical protein
MLYGRPLIHKPSTTRQSLSLPCAVDDEYLRNALHNLGVQPEEIPSLMACYHHALTLQEVMMGDILEVFYEPQQRQDTAFHGTRRQPEDSSENWNAFLMGRIRGGEFHDVLRLIRRLA